MYKTITVTVIGAAFLSFLVNPEPGRREPARAVASASGETSPPAGQVDTLAAAASPADRTATTQGSTTVSLPGAAAAAADVTPGDSLPSGSRTGEPPLDPAIRRALARMLNTSSEGLVEQTRNGTTSVDLQGRFQTAPVATVDERGGVHIRDYSHLPPAPAETPQP